MVKNHILMVYCYCCSRGKGWGKRREDPKKKFGLYSKVSIMDDEIVQKKKAFYV